MLRALNARGPGIDSKSDRRREGTARTAAKRAPLAFGLIGALLLAAFPAPAAASSTSADFSLSCTESPTDVGGAEAYWDWMTDGVVISNGSGWTDCQLSGGTDGTTARPAGANGIQVTLTVSAAQSSATKTVTKSFGEGRSFKVTISENVKDTRAQCRLVPYCGSSSATFTIQG